MKPVVLFGCGEYGKYAYHILKDKYTIVAFCDNDSSFWGSIMQEGSLSVISPGQITEGTEVIICVYKHFEEIAYQLEQLSISYNTKITPMCGE
jgi:hypothetical protein